jgi:hypothetical protein
MGGKNKGSGPQTTTTNPWAPQGAALQFGMDEAKNQYTGGGMQDPNSAYAGLSALTQQGIGNVQQGGQQAFDMLSKTAGGGFMGDSNPYLQDVVARSSRDVMSGLNSTFGAGGRTGGGLHQQALGTALGDVATNVYAPAYEQERNRMMQASSMMPQAAQMQIGAGQIQQQDALSQQLAQMAQNNQPYTDLSRYMGLISGQGGMGGSQISPGTQGRGAVAGAAGGAMAGGAVGGPYGALAGGILGGAGVI